MGDMLQIAEKEEWNAWKFIIQHERVLMEYYDRRGQYEWGTLDYADLVKRHGQYYEMGKEEEGIFKMQAQDFKVTITAMGSKTATGDFRKQMDMYMEEHCEGDWIMAPCGCMVKKGWPTQERETDESPKEDVKLGGQGGVGGQGGRTGYGGIDGQGGLGGHGRGKE